MSPSADIPAADLALGIHHILRDIITACDTPTLAALARTSKWVNAIVKEGSKEPKTRIVHGEVHRGCLRRRSRRRGAKRMATHPVRLIWSDLFCLTTNDDELRHTAIDLVGSTTPVFDKKTKLIFPEVVRLLAHQEYHDANPNSIGCRQCRGSRGICEECIWGGEGTTEVTYPRRMPRARCVVAFPFPWQADTLEPSNPWHGSVEVVGETNWVFDRAVYHIYEGNDNYDRIWSDVWDDFWDSSSILHLSPAWHTVLLVEPHYERTQLDAIIQRIVHLATIALQRRIEVPGAHVTVVFDRYLHDDPYWGLREANLDEYIREGTTTNLIRILEGPTADVTSPTHNKLIIDAVAAIKVISWAQYEASITLRQLELETIP